MNRMIGDKPNLFLVGAAKAGTTSLAAYLSEHPQVLLSPIKEPNHFNTEVDLNKIRQEHRINTHIDFQSYFAKPKLQNLHIAFVQNRDYYLSLFREAIDEKYLMDASTGYLYSPFAAQKIHEFNPDAKTIIILRDPVDRAISHYMMDAARGLVELEMSLNTMRSDFESSKKGYCVTNLYIDLSLYYNQVKRYLEFFPSENVLILSFEKLKSSPSIFFDRVTNFLQIEGKPIVENQIHNKTGTSPLRGVKKHLKGLKQVLPQSLVVKLKSIDALLSKPLDKNKLQQGTEGYIRSIVEEDWLKTQQEFKL